MAKLTVTFTALTPTPIGGYLVEYWPVGKKELAIGQVITTNTVTFNNVPAGAYEGTVKTVCSGGNYSNGVAFSANVVENNPYSINGDTSASCGISRSGMLTVNTAGYKAAVTTVYYSGTGTRPGSTLTILNGQTVVTTVSAPVSTSNSPVTVKSAAALPVGTYSWTLTTTDCSNGSGVSTFSMTNT